VAVAKARDLIFFGYSGSGDGTKERDTSFFLVAHTLKRHIQKRFPDDVVELVCAWHKDVFVSTLLEPGPDPSLKIRQIHYTGHGSAGSLSFGYYNPVAVADRERIVEYLERDYVVRLLKESVRRRFALMWESGLMSGFFSDALPADKRAKIKARLAPDALMHVWGCFAGAPTHTFDTNDKYWNLFNAGGSVDGLARHVAKTLEIETTAAHDPGNIHGLDFCFRTSAGRLNCSDKRPARLPHWLWPESRKVRWITYDATGAANETTINFLGERRPAKDIPPGQPPKWLTDEIPLGVAKERPPFPVCSAKRVGF
jgi:hypothetical protein